MKEYTKAEIEIILIEEKDVITGSLEGNETDPICIDFGN